KTKGKAEPPTEAETTTPGSVPQAVATPTAEGTTEPAAETPQKRRATQKADKGAKKLSAIDAAAKVLAESSTAMNSQELIQAMAAQGLWVSPGGKTPAATLYAALLRELQTKGAQAGFWKTERGKFVAAKAKR